jgi:hypothetical protein
VPGRNAKKQEYTLIEEERCRFPGALGEGGDIYAYKEYLLDHDRYEQVNGQQPAYSEYSQRTTTEQENVSKYLPCRPAIIE